MLTLNQIHAQIVTLANAHFQIAEVGMGTIAELQGKPDRLYPLLWLSNEGGSLEDNYKVDNIRLTMFGRVIAGEEGQDDDASEIEVLSDMQLILLDFLNYFHQQHGQEYVTDKSATLEHFTERTNDRTAGYSCVLELKQFYDWNKCQIPQSGASIPPSVDGLTLYDFCDQSVIDRLTATQLACLSAEFGGADVTIQVDGNTIATTAAGSTYSFRSKDTAGTTIGTIANPSVIADNTINFNGADVDTVKAEESYAFLVKLDGINSGTYNAGTNTVSVVSAVCADATTQVNAVNVGTVASGGTFDQQIHDSLGADVGTAANPSVIADTTIRNNATPTWTDTVEAEGTLTLAQAKALDSDGATTLLADYIPAADGFMFTCTPSALIPSLSVTVDDTTPSFGDTILVTATPTNFTPTGYRFYAQGTSDAMFIGTSATNTINWKVVAPNGAVSIYAEAVDGTGATAYTDTPQAITVSGALLNRFPTATMGFSLEQRCYRFFSSLLIIRRSSDNATSNFGFVNGSLDTASILTFCGAGDGFVVTWYGQSSNRNIAYQQTAASQPKIVSSGAMVTASNGKPAMDFDGVNDFMNILNTGSFVTGFFSYQNDAIATRLVQEIVACGTTFTAQVYAAGTATTGAGGGSGATAIASTVKDTNRHYMSIMTASNDGIYIDGTDITLGVLGTFTALVLIGNRGGQNFFMDGKIQDIIGYPDDQFANRAAIETYLT